ncbi:hypothetical protein B0H14DRAFT_2657540, partial [Mycena olivaceomarginata]
NPARGGKVETNNRDPRRGTLVEINAERMLWIRPPNIVDCTLGAWSYFREKTENHGIGEGRDVYAEIGQGQHGGNARTRESLCGEWLTTEEEYGRPVPDWPFRAPYGMGTPLPIRREPPVPESKDLPMRNSDGNGEPFQDVKAPAPMEGVESELTPPAGATSFADHVPSITLNPLPSPKASIGLGGPSEPDESPPLPLLRPARHPGGYRPQSLGPIRPRTDQGWSDAPVSRGAYRGGLPDAPRAQPATSGWPAEASRWGGGSRTTLREARMGSRGPPPRRDEPYSSPRLERLPPPNAPRGPNLPPPAMAAQLATIISDPPPAVSVAIFIAPAFSAPRTSAARSPGPHLFHADGRTRSVSPKSVQERPRSRSIASQRSRSRESGTSHPASHAHRGKRDGNKMFDFLFALQDETFAAKTKVRVELLVFKLKVTLLLPFSLQLSLPLPLPNPFQALAQVSSPAAPPCPEVALETPKGSSFLFEGGTYDEIALAFTDWTRSSSRFNVPLEERIGEEKKHRFRKHNRAQKRERKETKRRAKEDEERREWETQRRGGGYERYPPRDFYS